MSYQSNIAAELQHLFNKWANPFAQRKNRATNAKSKHYEKLLRYSHASLNGRLQLVKLKKFKPLTEQQVAERDAQMHRQRAIRDGRAGNVAEWNSKGYVEYVFQEFDTKEEFDEYVKENQAVIDHEEG
jgi:hypothetical protein